MAAAQTVAPATSGSAVPIAVPVFVPVGVPVVVPVAAPATATTAKGPKVAKKAKGPNSKGSKLSAPSAAKGPKRRRMF